MYQVDEKDAVAPLRDMPQCNAGAPLPAIAVAEHRLSLYYIASEPDPNWDGTYVNVLSLRSDDQAVVRVDFERPYAHFFGPPNDEAFAGHPLSDRGLSPYSAAEIIQSSWLRSLTKMNAVHPYHKDELFEKYRHFVFAFHDSTFECVAEDFTVSIERGSIVTQIVKGVCEW